MNYATGCCPICLKLDEDATITFANHYEKDGLLWEREIVSRSCGHTQVVDYPTEFSLSSLPKVSSGGLRNLPISSGGTDKRQGHGRCQREGGGAADG